MKQLLLFLSVSILSIGRLGAQSPQELRSYLPIIEGWTISQDIEVFNETNLYNRINGAAPLFFENNFREMTSMTYSKGDDYITIQAYRHATPEDAFGMYASERSPDMKRLDIGGEGQGDEYGIFFFAGSIYVKMSSSDEGETFSKAMSVIAKGFADKIDPNATYPELFKHFPEKGRQPHTEAYITKNYIGHEFLKPAYTVYYNWNDRIVQLFVIDGKTKAGAEEILKSYFAFTKQPAVFAEGNLTIQDRYNGNIPTVWKGRYIIGVYDETGYEFPDSIYELLKGVQL